MIEASYEELYKKGFESLIETKEHYPAFMAYVDEKKRFSALMTHIGGAAEGLYTLDQAQDAQGNCYDCMTEGLGRLDRINTLDGLLEALGKSKPNPRTAKPIRKAA